MTYIQSLKEINVARQFCEYSVSPRVLFKKEYLSLVKGWLLLNLG